MCSHRKDKSNSDVMSDISLSEKWLFPCQYCGIREKFVEEGKTVKRRVALLSYQGSYMLWNFSEISHRAGNT